MRDIVPERIIEDILASDRAILGELLDVSSSDLDLVARQKSLASGQLDLLYLHKDELLLLELKVVDFHEEMLDQVGAYLQDLRGLQKERKLIEGSIRSVLLVTGSSNADLVRCKDASVLLVTYDPAFVLSTYYENFRELSYFLTIRSGDFGVVRLGLLKWTLHLLSQGKSIREICAIEGRSAKTISNRLSVARHLGLVVKHKDAYFLSDYGNAVAQMSGPELDDRFNQDQIESLSDFVMQTPFYSSVTYTILAVLEAAFALSKSMYPVPKAALEDYFVKSVGKQHTWKTAKARQTACYMFSVYACELQFLARVGDRFFITPKGIRAILLLQLNRSIKLIESQRERQSPASLQLARR